MEGANKGQTPKKGISAPKNLNSGGKESNENECNKVGNAKKPVAKNFMSPTISAASKVAVPRKKILGERNGVPVFSDPNSLKSPNVGSRKDVFGTVSPKMIISSYLFASESDDEDKSSVTAYDPSSSYLSPRPKYLRYNPNRKRDVFLQLESMRGEGGDGYSGEESELQNGDVEVEEEFEEEDGVQNVEEESTKNQCLDVKRSVVSDSENDALKNVVEEGEDSNESAVLDSENNTFENVEEEVEESKIKQCLNVDRSEAFGTENSISEGVVKMDKEKDELEENDDEEVEDLDEEIEQSEEVRGWRLKGILKFLVVLCMFGLATLFASSLYSTVQNSEKVTSGPEDLYNSIRDYISEDVSMCMLKDGYGVSIVEADMVEPESMEADMVESESINWIVHEPVDNMLEDATAEELTDNHAKDSNSCSNDESEAQLPELLVEADILEFEEADDTLEDAAVEELTDSHATDSNSFGNEESNAQLPKVSVEADIVEFEAVDDMLKDSTVEELTDSHAQDSSSYGNEEFKAQLPELSVEADVVEFEAVDYAREIRLLQFKSSHAQESDSYADDDVPMSRKVDDVIVEESVDNIAAREIRLLQFKNKIVVGISALLSIMSGSLVFIFLSKGRRASKVSSISKTKLDSTEEPCPVTPIVEEKKIERLVQPSAAAASSLFDSSEQAAQAFTKMFSPTVQLLGELVVREAERSLRRCDKKLDNQLIESEESSNNQERKKKKKATFNISSPPPAQASPEYSIADSPSCYGSFTTEAKILIRENGKDAEFTTPVRRSSRIRSRSGDPSQ